LIDLSSVEILGEYFLKHQVYKKILFKFAKSKSLWERRISIITTFTFIRNRQFEDSLKIAKILLHDKEDLIHKAVGWMLREIGKRDLKTEENFLKEHYQTMPRTMLRYAIEKFPEQKRKSYLLNKI
jgi:3-methyladenine DNA glycosylase AlkD